MEAEEGPGYADFGTPGGRSDPRDIPRSGRRYLSSLPATAAASAGAQYGMLPSYYDELAEAAEPRHSGLGAGTAPPFGGGGGGGSSWPSHGLGDGFVSGGRHVLYCGADIPLEQLKAGHWHHEQRPRGCDPLQAAASSPRAAHAHAHSQQQQQQMMNLYEPAGALTSTSRGAVSGRGGQGAASREREMEGFQGGQRPMGHESAPWAPPFIPRERERAEPVGAEIVEDDVVEVETDTPGGYHVEATVRHPGGSNDPEEYVVAATAVMPPTHGTTGGGAPPY
ncbi:hypothetical protein VOLCADRAFT_96050 [Volvox carteri f. nagariensis]|uniref:Uncharacterized protein n=1 Tax=Volvox carteri f. nagariensis TaxID=3068 RepID=D8U929_VOLCA|nr:uncharacterized protein VOLCADRAFT_96050 [Volvox carteri f. nagariensis]EFJ43678.1 hypothetical protein VOLCADRAFT_96050 [Volvox carteri f. nagariensis]|eukprot:XP_002955159.1 hypothetical protein VOLCADRAFT_96050 [Volvox carteri f. nagariensis]